MDMIAPPIAPRAAHDIAPDLLLMKKILVLKRLFAKRFCKLRERAEPAIGKRKGAVMSCEMAIVSPATIVSFACDWTLAGSGHTP